MAKFNYKEIYMENGRSILEVNVLPQKYCNFDCIFCPIGRSSVKVEEQMSFDAHQESMKEFDHIIETTKPDLIFINSSGEALVNSQIHDIISFIKSKGLPIRLLSNGYLLNNPAYSEIANMCDEVIGEIKVVTEEDFQKVQRPIEGYTLENYIFNMISFNQQYKGRFIFEITIIKGYNDDEESIQKLKKIIKLLNPSEVIVVRMEDGPFKKKLGITDERFAEIKMLLSM